MYTPIYKLDYKLRESPVAENQDNVLHSRHPSRICSSLKNSPLNSVNMGERTSPFSSKRNYTERGLRRWPVILLDRNQSSSLPCCTSRSSFCACSKSAKRCSSSARKISACS